jgi:hypothetical protein
VNIVFGGTDSPIWVGGARFWSTAPAAVRKPEKHRYLAGVVAEDGTTVTAQAPRAVCERLLGRIDEEDERARSYACCEDPRCVL